MPDALDIHFASELRKHSAMIDLFAGFVSHANHVVGAMTDMQPADWHGLEHTRAKLCQVTQELGEQILRAMTGPTDPVSAAAEVVSTSSAPVASLMGAGASHASQPPAQAEGSPSAPIASSQNDIRPFLPPVGERLTLPATADPYGADETVLLEISDILSAEAQRALKEAV